MVSSKNCFCGVAFFKWANTLLIRYIGFKILSAFKNLIFRTPLINFVYFKHLKYCLSIFCFFISWSTYSQHPYSTKWYSVETPHVKIIADKSINQQDIFRIANSVDKVFACDTVSLKSNPRRVPLVVANTAVSSNGYVTLFPYKMYWFGLPYRDNALGIGEWYQNLAVHEYRHVVQNQVLNHGFTKLSSYVAGAYGRSAMRFSVPNWWFEGDAVYAETVLTSAGRGRAASFNRLTLAILDTHKKNYMYDKMVNGSYRDYLPNQYELGYHLVTHGRIIGGYDVWSKTARRASWYSFWPWAFGSAFKHFSGVNLTKNYNQTMNQLRTFCANRLDSLIITDANIITKKHHRSYTSYSNPRYINDTTIVALKSSLSEPSKIVKISLSGNETDLFYTETSTFDCNNSTIIWSTTTPDIRWTLRGYSDIAIYDFKTNRRYRITHKGHYYSPTISPNGKLIAAIEFDESRNTKLVIFKAEYIGEHISKLRQIRQVSLQYGEYLRGLRFANNNVVLAVSNLNNRNAIVEYDVNLLQRNELTIYTNELINNVCGYNNFILYDSEYSGISNIWLLNTKTNERKMITSRKYSATQPDILPNGHTFIYSDFLATGANIVSATFDNNAYTDINNVKVSKLEYFTPLIPYEPYQQLDFVANAPTENVNNFVVKPYKPYHNLIRCYGWLPQITDQNISGTIYSQNTLETFSVYVNETYRMSADYWQTTIGATYSGFYPVLNFSVSFDTDADKYYFRNRYGKVYSQYLYWNSKTFNFGVSFPFNFSRFNWSQHLVLTPQISHYSISDKLTDNFNDMGNDNFNILHGKVEYSLYRAKALRDFNSVLGFSVQLDALKAVDCHRQAQKFKVLSSFTVPGLFKQNSLTISGAYMRQIKNYDPNSIYLFSDSDLDIQGYSSVRSNEAAKLFGEYSFPLGYPDFGIPAVLWAKRFRASLFADMASSILFGYRFDFASLGCKFLCDLNVLRIPNNVSLGFIFAKPLIDNVYSSQKFGILFSYQM